jgi:branched-chain amino acid transport system ATP-binding protein
MLEIREIDVYYGTVKALRQVSLKVEADEFVVVIGSNGAGKTTLLKTISGLLTPRTGEIIFSGERIDGMPPHLIAERGIAHVFEGRHLFPSMTVMENLEMGCYNKGARLKKENNLKMVFELFPVLKERSSQFAGRLSGGEQQMLAIARSLMSGPKLLLCDELSLGLAPIVVEKIYSEIIEELKTLGLTVLLVEQNVPLALSVADRAYVLENGKVMMEGKSSDLLNSDNVKKAYLGI